MPKQPGKRTGKRVGAKMRADEPDKAAPRGFTFRGRQIEILPMGGTDRAMPGHHMATPGVRVDGLLRIDGREVAYEQTDEGVMSHEFMYQRFGTPEELAEELVRQWGTHIPEAMPMPMPHAKHRSPRKRRGG